MNDIFPYYGFGSSNYREPQSKVTIDASLNSRRSNGAKEFNKKKTKHTMAKKSRARNRKKG